MRKLIFALLFILLIALSGCKSNDNSNSLTVYYFKDVKIFENAINSFETANPDITINKVAFENKEDMRSRMEESSNDADVFLFSYKCADVNKMIKNKKFADLNAYFEKDASFDINNYYSPAINAGINKGKKYIVPLSISVPFYISSSKRLEEDKISLPAQPSFTELTNEIKNNINSPSEKMKLTVVKKVKSDDLSSFIRASGFDFINYETGKINFDKDNEAFKEIAEYSKSLYANDAKLSAVKNSLEDSSEPLLSAVSLWYSDLDMPFYSNYFNSLYNKTNDKSFVLYPVPTYNNSQKFNAAANYLGAVSKKSKNKELAYKLLRTAMDSDNYSSEDSPELKMVCYASISKSVNNAHIEELAKRYPHIANKLTFVYDNLLSCSIPNYKLDETISGVIEKYYKDEISYDDCIKELSSNIKKYFKSK